MSAKDFKHHMLNELRELERLIRNDCGRDNELDTSYEPEELKWFEKLHELQELCEGKKVDMSENTLTIQRISNSLHDLDGKTIPVTFHVSKFEPKIDIDLSNDY